MTPPARTRGTRVECYGRETLPAPVRCRREVVTERLATLVDAGRIDDLDVSAWPKRIPCDGAVDPSARDRYLALRTWASENGVRLAPFFQTRGCYSMETGERGDWIVLPALCMVVYEGDEIETVYPHADGESYRSVLDGLARLEDAADHRPDGPESMLSGHAD